MSETYIVVGFLSALRNSCYYYKTVTDATKFYHYLIKEGKKSLLATSFLPLKLCI